MFPAQSRRNGEGAALLHLHEDAAALQAAATKGGKEKPRNEEAVQACLSCSVLYSDPTFCFEGTLNRQLKLRESVLLFTYHPKHKIKAYHFLICISKKSNPPKYYGPMIDSRYLLTFRKYM